MFYAKVTWYNEYQEKEEVTHMMLPAASYTEACKEIERAYKDAFSIQLEQLYKFNENDIKCVYIPADVVDHVKAENIF